MAAGATYEPIATQTLASAAASITFSSIAASWTDLRVVLVYKSDSASPLTRLRFNSDSATNYSFTNMVGDGATASGNRGTSTNQITTDTNGASTTIPTYLAIDIFSYAGSTNKTCLIEASEDRNGSGQVTRGVGLWRNTTAITSVNLFTTSVNYAIGTTATLYGILKA